LSNYTLLFDEIWRIDFFLFFIITGIFLDFFYDLYSSGISFDSKKKKIIREKNKPALYKKTILKYSTKKLLINFK
jgi:hypothetical protein